jgi:hypothetical protein
MYAARRIPQRQFDHTAGLFMTAFATFEAARHTILALGLSLSNEILRVLCEANEMSEMITKRRSAVHYNRLERLLGQVEGAAERLANLEFKFLTALCTKDLLRGRVNALHPSVYSLFWERIEARMSEWDAIRVIPKVTLADVRSSYGRLIDIVEKAEAMSVETAIEKERQSRIAGRIHLVLTPSVSKPAPDKKKDKRLRDSARRNSMKGDENGRVGVTSGNKQQKAG